MSQVNWKMIFYGRNLTRKTKGEAAASTTHKIYDSQSIKFLPQQNKTHNLKSCFIYVNTSLRMTQHSTPLESKNTTQREQKIFIHFFLNLLCKKNYCQRKMKEKCFKHTKERREKGTRNIFIKLWIIVEFTNNINFAENRMIMVFI